MQKLHFLELDNLFKYVLIEEKISKWEENKSPIGFVGHTIFDSSKYASLKDGYYKIISQRFPSLDLITSVEFYFENKKIFKVFNEIKLSSISADLYIDLDRQIIVHSAHSAIYSGNLKVRLYKIK